VTWRSVLLGLLAILVICGLTPFNNYVMRNTDLVGNYLPAGLLTLLILFTMLVNAPLWRFAPRHALSSGELAVSLGMALVGCAFPSEGLMRYLPGHLVAYWRRASEDYEVARLMSMLGLPDWLFPSFGVSDPVARGASPIVGDFFGRVPVDTDTFLSHLLAVPWGAWITPAFAWALFIFCLFGAILCLSVILRRQWAENERLPFPIAGIYLSVIEPPAPGHAFNALFRHPAFWIAFAGVFVFHGLYALHQYAPRFFPEIPHGYNLAGLFAEPPFNYTEGAFKGSRISFTIIGIMLFVQTRVSFSLWFTFVAVQVVRMVYGSVYQTELAEAAAKDSVFGGMFVYALAVLWVGRHHLAMVGRQMVRGLRPGEPVGRYLPNWLAGWAYLACSFGAILWLTYAGASWPGAIVAVLMLMLLYVNVSRIVAETGLLYVLFQVPLTRPWVFLANDLPAAMTFRTTLRSFFLGGTLYGMLADDTRENLSVYASHALRIADETVDPGDQRIGRTLPLMLCLVLALVVSYAVAGASTLYVNYSYAATLDVAQESPINDWGTASPQYFVTDPAKLYVPPGTGPVESHGRFGSFVFGAVVTSILSFLRLRLSWWPLHPVGYLLAFSWGVQMTWFSIMIGWLIKVVLVRYGGAGLFRRSRPLFIGLIMGEAAAIGFWLIVSMALLSMGLEYRAILLLPV
jgi:hypothetical protein